MSKAFINKILLEGDYPVATGIEWLGEDLCQVEREKVGFPGFLLGIVWEHHVTQEDVVPFLDSNVDFVVSIPSGAYWDGAAIRACERGGAGWGGVGTLKSGCNQPELSSVTAKETYFARRALRQHSNVATVEYLNSLMFEVTLLRGKVFRVALSDAYDVTSEHVRTAWDQIGPFHLVLKNNPNGSITQDARDSAGSLGVQVLNIGDLMRFLGRS